MGFYCTSVVSKIEVCNGFGAKIANSVLTDSFCRHGQAAKELRENAPFYSFSLVSFLHLSDFQAHFFFSKSALLVRFPLRSRPRNLPIRFCVDSVKFLDISRVVTSGDYRQCLSILPPVRNVSRPRLRNVSFPMSLAPHHRIGRIDSHKPPKKPSIPCPLGKGRTL
jgi:hypothetical protein